MELFVGYTSRLSHLLAEFDWSDTLKLAKTLKKAWETGNRVFICGNGGSAANAIHLANDLIYGVAPKTASGIKALALCANQSVMTCLANEIEYENIFAYQLQTMGGTGDVLIAFSGSGNSRNIVFALEVAKKMDMTTAAVVGFNGGESFKIADVAIHFPIDDMQIAEDCQQIVGHMVTRWLKDNPAESLGKSETRKNNKIVETSPIEKTNPLIQPIK